MVKYRVTIEAGNQQLTQPVGKCRRVVSADGFGNLFFAEYEAVHHHLTAWFSSLATLVDAMTDNLPLTLVEAVAVLPAFELCF